MTPITITPEPCGRLVSTISRLLEPKIEVRCGDTPDTITVRCDRCLPLGDRIHYAQCDSYHDGWMATLPANLAMASLLCRAAERAVHDYCTPVVMIHSADMPADEMRRRIDAMDAARETSRMVLVGPYPFEKCGNPCCKQPAGHAPGCDICGCDPW